MLIRAYTSIIAACLLWSLNPAANKLALEEIAVPQLVFMRAVFAAFIFPSQRNWLETIFAGCA